MKQTNTTDIEIFDLQAVNEAIAAMPSDYEINRLMKLFKALSDNTRMQIILSITDRELTVGDIANVLSMTKSAVSHQLKTLKDNNLVKQRKVGKLVYYTLDDDHVTNIIKVAFTHIKHSHEHQ